MPGGNYAATHIVCPDPCPCAFIRIRRHQMRSVLWERFFEKLAENSAFVQWLILVLKRRNETARIEIK